MPRRKKRGKSETDELREWHKKRLERRLFWRDYWQEKRLKRYDETRKAQFFEVVAEIESIIRSSPKLVVTFGDVEKALRWVESYLTNLQQENEMDLEGDTLWYAGPTLTFDVDEENSALVFSCSRWQHIEERYSDLGIWSESLEEFKWWLAHSALNKRALISSSVNPSNREELENTLSDETIQTPTFEQQLDELFEKASPLQKRKIRTRAQREDQELVERGELPPPQGLSYSSQTKQFILYWPETNEKTGKSKQGKRAIRIEELAGMDVESLTMTPPTYRALQEALHQYRTLDLAKTPLDSI